MKGALRQALTVAAKDLRVAGRTRDTLLATAFFAGIVLLVLGFALSGGVVSRDARLSAPLAAGAIWTALALAAAVGAQRAFAQEQEAGALDQLLAYPGPHGALYLGKLLGVLPPLLLVAAVTVPTGLVLFGASEAVTAAGRALPWAALALTTALGVLGFAATTTFYGSITVNLRAREALLPALAFPILVPAVLATVQATRLLLEGGWSPEVGTWLTFLTAFDLGTVILATLLFPAAVEG
ncbi:heme exporter protein CcmB [Deinococcus soli (ex Cha et al. 2016)]|uniref:Heme exporter protein B n=2 Tax=Deinococcus soli (ex Cha et al. 2016) TaxID=1309411 RepID=A0AAE3X8E2_9DEIO|nr:heme exporter protein CcmB [Deinococcus soli (ex Cha et al. 2016)]MDR6216732.1 heme exporter protein B [Deinococcus soli (ex Cha et al. 2016)]MDR6327553.1 heme exporter protein B [Deinococcus soli (ex Cha et al. 2016)]MDR6749828.1 heme exporter protein B [Deinococcus soli (ex Cha et al. 2016)]